MVGHVVIWFLTLVGPVGLLGLVSLMGLVAMVGPVGLVALVGLVWSCGHGGIFRGEHSQG